MLGLYASIYIHVHAYDARRDTRKIKTPRTSDVSKSQTEMLVNINESTVTLALCYV